MIDPVGHVCHDNAPIKDWGPTLPALKFARVIEGLRVTHGRILRGYSPE